MREYKLEQALLGHMWNKIVLIRLEPIGRVASILRLLDFP